MKLDTIFVESDPDNMPWYVYREMRGEMVYYGKSGEKPYEGDTSEGVQLTEDEYDGERFIELEV